MAETVEEFFAALPGKVDPGKTAGINAVFQMNLSGEGGGQWYVSVEDGVPSVSRGEAPNPNITLSATAQDWLDIVNRKLSGQAAFMTGKLRVQGDISLAMKLQSIM